MVVVHSYVKSPVDYFAVAWMGHFFWAPHEGTFQTASILFILKIANSASPVAPDFQPTPVQTRLLLTVQMQDLKSVEKEVKLHFSLVDIIDR